MSKLLEGIMDVLTDPRGIEAELALKLNYCLERITAEPREGLDRDDSEDHRLNILLMEQTAERLVERHKSGRA